MGGGWEVFAAQEHLDLKVADALQVEFAAFWLCVGSSAAIMTWPGAVTHPFCVFRKMGNRAGFQVPSLHPTPLICLQLLLKLRRSKNLAFCFYVDS